MFSKPCRIAILGIGGVGGYYGAKLAAHYSGSEDIEIIFIARGENEHAIKTKGLKLITDEGEIVAHPSIISSNPYEIGEIDFLLCCTKSYNLEKSISEYRDCISDGTILLSLLNGVDNRERIKALYPENEVWDGCVYIVARLIAPGIVKVSGKVNMLHFGTISADQAKPDYLNTVFKSADINANLSSNIEQKMWEKFLFISPLASLTSYLNLPVGGIMSNTDHKELLLNLITELKLIADKKVTTLPDDIIQKIMDKVSSLPYETTSSMHSDFQKGTLTEVNSLTTYVVEQGKKLSIPTPFYDTMLEGLIKK